jgi:hypothetical protein
MLLLFPSQPGPKDLTPAAASEMFFPQNSMLGLGTRETALYTYKMKFARSRYLEKALITCFDYFSI